MVALDRACGTSPIHTLTALNTDSSPLQRRFRDVHVATQHIMVAPASWELAGRLLLGLPTDVSQL